MGRMMTARQDNGAEEASLGFIKISIFVHMPLAELKYTF